MAIEIEDSMLENEMFEGGLHEQIEYQWFGAFGPRH